jgi:hypothetical protein
MAAAAPESKTCLDCGAPLLGQQRYCQDCGQRATVQRLSLHEIGHDLLHALIHVDRSVISLLRNLALRPGLVVRDYVRGARRRYFGPFAFLVVAVALASLAIVLVDLPLVVVPGNAIADFYQKHPNLLFLVQVPILALLCRTIFLRGPYNFAEYLVLAAYTTGMRTIFLTLVVLPVWYMVRPTGTAVPLLALYWLLWCAYFAWATTGFVTDRKRWEVAIGAALAAFAAQAATGYAVNWFAATFARTP